MTEQEKNEQEFKNEKAFGKRCMSCGEIIINEVTWEEAEAADDYCPSCIEKGVINNIGELALVCTKEEQDTCSFYKEGEGSCEFYKNGICSCDPAFEHKILMLLKIMGIDIGEQQ